MSDRMDNINIDQQHHLSHLSWPQFDDQIPQKAVRLLLLSCVSAQTFSAPCSPVTAVSETLTLREK